MLEHSPETTPEIIQPLIVIHPKVDPNLILDPQQIAETMRELDISEEGIARTAIVAEAKFHLAILGSTTLKSLHRLTHRKTEFNQGPGALVRISTKFKGKPRSAEAINHTLTHELEHVAQIERRDPKLLGLLNIVGSIALGAKVGNKIGKKTGSRVAQGIGTLIGAYAGHHLAYWHASPHEDQARMRAEQVTTRAVSRK